MFVDDPEEIIQLRELLEGVSVDGPPLVTVSQWIGQKPQLATSHKSVMNSTSMQKLYIRQ